MADTGWLNLTTFSSVGGSRSWSNPSNASASDNVRAIHTVLSTTASSNAYLHGVQLVSSTVPGGATIDGIEVRVEGYRNTSGAGVVDFETVQLIVGGTASGSNLAAGTMPAGAGAEAYTSFGGATSLWGLTPTDSDVNGATFGVRLRVVKINGKTATANIDHVQMKIYYSVGGGANTTNFFQFMT